MASPTSFKPLLTKWCKAVKPSRILEWGPGESTLLMEKLRPKAKILSLEHQKVWYKKWVNHFGVEGNVLLLLSEASEEDRSDKEWREYTNPTYSDMKFDLIFIDGRERVKCLEFAKKVISDKGVVILHDSERGEYAEGIKLFDVVEEDNGTIILKKSPLTPVKD